MAVRLRLRVSGLRFFAAHDLAVNGAIADLHRHIVNGCGLRQRERIDRFDLIGERIGKLLRHGHTREKACDLGLHVRVFERTTARRSALRVERRERAFVCARCAVGCCLG